MNLNLKNKNALICGSTAGIGKATAMELANLGANITLIARNEEKLKKVISDLPTNQGQNHNYMVADFNDPNSLKGQVYEIEQYVHCEILNAHK